VKFLIKILFSITFSIFLVQISSAQYLGSTYKPKNKKEKLVLAKIYALPEIKEWLTAHKKSKADLIIDVPDSTENYSIHVGLANLGMFRTSYHLSINPKTLAIYYDDFMDTSGVKSITLKRWRQWRNKPGFHDLHIWKAGKLVVLEDDKKKNSQPHR